MSEHDAADILQDVFASLTRSIHRFEHRQAGSFRSWLWTITRNHVALWFRDRADQAPAAGGTLAWQDLANVADSLSDDPDEFTDRSELTALHQRGLEIVRSEFED
jgi:DNA-directed RNA polymerase specialized sigma24 family protein